MKSAKTCPICNEEIKQRKKGGCPNCGVKLKLVTKKEGNFNIGSYVVDKKDYVEKKKKSPTVDSRNIIVDKADIFIERLNGTHWHIKYYALPQRGICPNCKRVLFKKPRFLKGSQELKCTRCHHFVTTEFQVLNRNIPVK